MSNIPALFMMVGLPGSGKSYYAEHLSHFANVYSSDNIREELLGDKTDQSQQNLVFDTLHNRVFDCLKSGKDAVYDATNIHYKRRMAFLNQLNHLGIKCYKICCFIATPYEICLKNNAERSRSVPEHVIERMYHKFDIPMMCEGWDFIVIMDHDDQKKDPYDLLMSLCKIEHDNPHHQFSIGQHCITSWAYACSNYPDSDHILKLSTLLHDIGKANTKVFHDTYGNPSETAHYYSHERVGAYESFSYTTEMSVEDRLRVALLIRWHMYPFVIEKSQNPKKTLSKFVTLVGEQTYNDILKIHDCDLHAH